MKVLLVEDFAPIRDRLCELVQMVPGAQIVAQADDPTAALAAIREHEPDVAIVDLQLRAGTSGLTILKWLREHRPAIAAIVLSNSAYAQMRTACLDLGARLFLDKAVEFARLPDVLTELSGQLPPAA
ncbi:MAG TPA: response regulator [Trinickia sp.]|uniref:response regulator n=1 Tax=Trinickia sp. TaxID=2571163 RepID=UPI002C5BC47D|nr:response regulator [Trinickia sp.]HVW53588.1 response regulator [Trinickia sp.]